MKEERTGGRKEREIESQREVVEGRHGKHNNTEVKVSKEPNFIKNNCPFFSYKSPFIDYGDEE